MRTLPLRLAPVAGESLPGYLARYSHTFGLSPGDLIRALGLDGGTGAFERAGRYGVWLSAEQLDSVAFVSGIAPKVLKGMLPSRYAGLAFEEDDVPSRLLSGATQTRHVLVWTSRYCPLCLRQDGAWRLGWQLCWCVACATHRALLERQCPRCGLIPKIGTRWSRDENGRLVDPTRCARRIDGELCLTPLSDANPQRASAAALRAQDRVEQVMMGRARPTLAGEQLAPLVWLRDVLALCHLLARHAPSEVSERSPSGSRSRRLLDHPAALAAVLPDALELADLPSQETLADALQELADRRYHTDGRTLLISKSVPTSDLLTGVMRRALAGCVWATPSSQIGLHPCAHRRPEDLDRHLEASHVPQLFWAQEYERDIAELFDFDDFSRWHGRRFCSVLLARMLTPLGWHDAVRYLDFPETAAFINDGYNTTLAKLRTKGRSEELAARIKRIANQHAAEELVDYKQRRTLLSDWSGIDLDCWHLLRPRDRPQDPYQRFEPRRRAHASVWLWCQITSGHERAAPIPLPNRNLAHHTYFIRDTLPALQERLEILAALMLRTPADACRRLHNRFADELHRRGQ